MPGPTPSCSVTPDFSGETDLPSPLPDAPREGLHRQRMFALAQRAPSGKHGYYIQFHIDIPKTNEGARCQSRPRGGGRPGRACRHVDRIGIRHPARPLCEGWSNGADDCPLSSMACAPGGVRGGVGLAPEWPKVDGTTETIWQYDTYTLGDVAPFSSYGVLPTGARCPHVVAPGAALISVLSTPLR